MEKSLVESKTFPGFYYVPGLVRILINTKGQVIDLNRRCCLLAIIDNIGYLSINCNGKTFHLHRLLGLTFIEYPENVILSELVINHIDGNKLNNSLDNLEWVTYSGNIIHAYKTGLRNDNRPVLMKDIRTNEIQRFYSVSELARTMNVDPSLVVVYLKPYNREKLCWNFYSLIYEGESWPVIDTNQIGKHRNGTSKSVVVTDLNKNELYVFNSLGETCKHFNLNYSMVAMRIYRQKDALINSLSIKYIDDPSIQKEIIA